MNIINGRLIGTTPEGVNIAHKVQFNDAGYPYVRAEGHTYQVSRLIHDFHVFDAEGRGRIEFIDGDKTNLDPSNLRVASQSWLNRKAQRNNRFAGRAISHGKIAEVRELVKTKTKAQVARMFGVTPRTIRRAISA